MRHSTSSDNLSDSDKSTDQLDDSLPPSEYQFLSLQEEARTKVRQMINQMIKEVIRELALAAVLLP